MLHVGHAISLFIESKIVPVNMIYFDKIANLMHDIWKRLYPSSPLLLTTSNEIHGYNTKLAARENYLRKEIKSENFQRCFSRTGAIWNPISADWRDLSEPLLRKKFVDLYLRLFQTA